MKERDLISLIRRRFPAQADHLLRGIGDDCAVFAGAGEDGWLVTTDLLADGVHFIMHWHDPYLLGRKAIAVNLSDIAAMAGKPRFVLISLTLPDALTDEWLDKWHGGVESMLEEYGCVLIGGDTSRGALLTINVTVIGSAPRQDILYRSGAGAGHDIYVTGPLGSSAAGLEILRRGLAGEQYAALVHSHLDPTPRVRIGQALGKSGLVSAMQDISDGVATDMSHICAESGLGAIIYGDKLPHATRLVEVCHTFGLDPLDLMLRGGEDYELLFTADPAGRKELDRLSRQLACPFHRIGVTVRQPAGVRLDHNGETTDISYGGFEHK